MKIGIPKGLLYSNNHNFYETFFYELGAEIITSEETNKQILNDGVKYCIDEACLPVKVFHGHIASIMNKCDAIFIPRIMQLQEKEYICPKFCGLPEMVKNNIPNLPEISSYPIYAWNKRSMVKWAKKTGGLITKNKGKIEKALELASSIEKPPNIVIKNNNYPYMVALAGHPYNIQDSFVNMNLIKKLNNLRIGVVTEEMVSKNDIKAVCSCLYKRPFWTFTTNSFGFSTFLAKKNEIDGIIYVSSFGCGTDSITIELIKNHVKGFPFLLLKIDEHTGEAGFDTRIEAFKDMLERRVKIESNFSTYG